jgi:hypothetical protein
VSLNSKDILAQKQQDTAAAVSQMRERLKAMGILEKTAQQKDCSNQPPHEFSPPPPPPPPFFPSDDVGKADGDDDTVSTVSGGSDRVEVREGLQVDGEVEEEESEEIDEIAYRKLLR